MIVFFGEYTIYLNLASIFFGFMPIIIIVNVFKGCLEKEVRIFFMYFNNSREYGRVFVNVFVNILLSNLLSLLPFVGGITFDISYIVSIRFWSLISSFMFFSYFKKYFLSKEEKTLLGESMSRVFRVLEIFSYFIFSVSLSIRLIVNMFVGHLFIYFFSSLIIIQVAFYFFEIFISFIQSYIFRKIISIISSL